MFLRTSLYETGPRCFSIKLCHVMLYPVVNLHDARNEADLSTSCPFSERNIKNPTSSDSCISKANL